MKAGSRNIWQAKKEHSSGLRPPSPIPLRETGEGYNLQCLRPFAPSQMGEGPEGG